MHVAGLLFCKFCYHDHLDRTLQPAHLYPAHPRLHIVERSVLDMPLSECLTFLLAIQHDWRDLVLANLDAALPGVLACAARLAHLASGRHPATVLDMEEHVEPGGDTSTRLLTRKALRSALTTVHGLLRTWVLHANAERVFVVESDNDPPPEHHTKPTGAERLSKQTLRKIHAIWRRREASQAVSAEDLAWQDLAKCLDPVSIGDAPRKSTRGMRTVVRAARSLGGAERGPDGTAEIPAEALQAVIEAMRFYYVLPAATMFRTLALQACLPEVARARFLCFLRCVCVECNVFLTPRTHCRKVSCLGSG